MSPGRAFATVFMAVFLLIFIASALITFTQPQTFAATARVSLPGSDTSSADHFLSTTVLTNVSKDLDLANRLAREYGQTSELSEDRVVNLLLRSIQVQTSRGSNILEIRAYGRTPQNCAELANAVAERGAADYRSPSGFARLVDRALPPTKAARPNVPLNLALGAIVGAFLGTMAGGVGAKLAVGFDGKRPGHG
jgi:uncharacterized protein involved in exopolysaccharide biosynthesis